MEKMPQAVNPKPELDGLLEVTRSLNARYYEMIIQLNQILDSIQEPPTEENATISAPNTTNNTYRPGYLYAIEAANQQYSNNNEYLSVIIKRLRAYF